MLYHELLEAIGPVLGLKLGRKHYFSTLIVPLAVRAWVERAAAADPEVARLLAAYEQRQQEQAYAAADRRRQRRLNAQSLALLGTAPDDVRVIARHGKFEAPDRGEVDRHAHALLDLARAGNKPEFVALFEMVRDRSTMVLVDAERMWEHTRAQLGLAPPGEGEGT